MALADKFQTIESLLTIHYQALNKGDRRHEIREVIEKLRDMGATTEATLQELTAADFESLGIPPLVARKIAKAVGCTGDTQKQVVIIDDNPVNLAARLTPEELVERYDPNDPVSPYAMRLKEISGEKQFFVYNTDGLLDVPNSQNQLRELLDGFPPLKSALIDGKITELYAVGGRPARYADENPVITGEMLRPNGLSNRFIDWGAVSKDVRQLIRIAVSCQLTADGKSEIAPNETYVYELVKGLTFDEVARRFPLAAVEFEKQKGLEKLPSLKIALKSK